MFDGRRAWTNEQPIGATEGKAYALAVLASPAAESAPAADAGIVALTGEVASVIMGTAEVEDEDGRSWGAPLYSTEERAWRAARRKVEREAGRKLAQIDREIARCAEAARRGGAR